MGRRIRLATMFAATLVDREGRAMRIRRPNSPISDHYGSVAKCIIAISPILVAALLLSSCGFGCGSYRTTGWVNNAERYPGSEASHSALKACNAESTVSVDDCMRAKGWRFEVREGSRSFCSFAPW
jgi:hypothetical protein